MIVFERNTLIHDFFSFFKNPELDLLWVLIGRIKLKVLIYEKVLIGDHHINDF